MIWTYLIIAVMLLAVELLYFRIADHFNIVDKPNERSSHSRIVLCGGGIIFTLSFVAWAVMLIVQWKEILGYFPFLVGLLMVTIVSFWDDVHSLPDSFRMAVQIVSTLLMFWSVGLMQWSMWWVIPIALFFCVGATNFINFMDGINGITAAYAMAMLIPIALLNKMPDQVGHDVTPFIEPSYLIVAILGVLVFSIFNFRPKGKAKCFAGMWVVLVLRSSSSLPWVG